MTERRGATRPLPPTIPLSWSETMSVAHSIELLSDDAFGWYLTGLTDGEGCFLLCPQKPNGKAVGWRWMVRFDIVMRDDESENIAAIAKRMACGKVHWRKGGAPCRKPAVGESPEQVPKANPRVGWWVFRIDELANRVVPQFDRFPLQFKKAKDFATWREAILILHDIHLRVLRMKSAGRIITKRVRTLEEEEALCSLFKKLTAVRKYNGQSPVFTELSKRQPLLF